MCTISANWMIWERRTFSCSAVTFTLWIARFIDLAMFSLQLQINDQRFEDADDEMEHARNSGHH